MVNTLRNFFLFSLDVLLRFPARLDSLPLKEPIDVSVVGFFLGPPEFYSICRDGAMPPCLRFLIRYAMALTRRWGGVHNYAPPNSLARINMPSSYKKRPPKEIYTMLKINL